MRSGSKGGLSGYSKSSLTDVHHLTVNLRLLTYMDYHREVYWATEISPVVTDDEAESRLQSASYLILSQWLSQNEIGLNLQAYFFSRTRQGEGDGILVGWRKPDPFEDMACVFTKREVHEHSFEFPCIDEANRRQGIEANIDGNRELLEPSSELIRNVRIARNK